MAAFVHNLYIEKGADFRQDFIYYEGEAGGAVVDLTGQTARMMIRKNVKAGGEPLLELTTENGGIEIDIPEGKITVIITNEQTQTLPGTEGYYDLELVNGPLVERFLQGDCEFSDEATR